MNWIKFFVLISIICTSGCIKKNSGCTAKQPAQEEQEMIAYCNANNISYTKHPSGILYQIINPGNGATPNLNSRIFITYTGKLLNGTTFDAVNDPARTGWLLSGLIEGWQIGVPLIQKGGTIKMVIPSALAYGCASPGGSVPANAILYFEVNLVDVQ